MPSVELSLSAVLLLLSPSWHHYASCIPFFFAVLWTSNLSSLGRVLLIFGWLIQAIPVLLLGFDVYYSYSAFGGTFWSIRVFGGFFDKYGCSEALFGKYGCSEMFYLPIAPHARTRIPEFLTAYKNIIVRNLI